MKILIVSDTHGRIHKTIDFIEHNPDISLCLHLGDSFNDVEDLRVMFPKLKIDYVLGNSDFLNAPYFRVMELMGVRVALTHGHNYNVRSGLVTLSERALAKEASLCLFGHTHVPFNGYVNGVHMFNPGSAALPLEGSATCGILTINETGYEINTVCI